MKLHISTQVYENYGWHNFDGKGACPQRWKAKGGSDYYYPLPEGFDLSQIGDLVDGLQPQVSCDDESWREWMIDWEVVADDFLTGFERFQLEDSGSIRYPAKVLKQP